MRTVFDPAPIFSTAEGTVYGFPWDCGLLCPAASELWSPAEANVNTDFRRIYLPTTS